MHPKDLLKRTNLDELIETTPETRAEHPEEVEAMPDERFQKRSTVDPLQSRFASADMMDKIQGPYRNRRVVYGAWFFLIVPCAIFGLMLLHLIWWDSQAGGFRAMETGADVFWRAFNTGVALAIIGLWPYLMYWRARKAAAKPQRR